MATAQGIIPSEERLDRIGARTIIFEGGGLWVEIDPLFAKRYSPCLARFTNYRSLLPSTPKQTGSGGLHV